MNNFLTNKKISVVIACYNEEKNIRVMYERLAAVFKDLTPNYEFIYVDNASLDNSRKEYEALINKDKGVTAILMSRNFGYSDISFSAGSEYATGDAVVWIDGDIEDPPELIKDFVKKWLEGYEVVYGVRTKRKANLVLRLGSKIFYRILNKISYIDMPVDAGDFSLLDRKVVDVFNKFPERDRFIRGLRSWIGFRQIGISYTREGRKAGATTITGLSTYFRIAERGVLSFSYKPLEWISYFAFFVVILAVIAIFIYFILYFVLPQTPRGIPTVIILVLILGSAQLFSLAVIAEYLGKIFEEVKGRPKYIIRDILKS